MVEAEAGARQGTPFRRQGVLGVRAAEECAVEALGCIAEAAAEKVGRGAADGFRAVRETLLACAGRHVVEVDGVVGVWHGALEQAGGGDATTAVLEGRITDAENEGRE